MPDARLDRLTAMFNPRKRVPATVEFTDLAATGQAGVAKTLGGRRARTRTPTRSFTCCGRFRTRPFRIRPARSIRLRDAQAMEDELILADLGVAERRLERLERISRRPSPPDLEREREVVTLCRSDTRGRQARCATLDLKGDDLKRLRGFQFLSAKPLLIVINLDEAVISADARAAADDHRAAEATGLTAFLKRGSTAAAAVCAKIELEISAARTGRRARRFSRISV